MNKSHSPIQAQRKNRLVTKDGSGRYWASNGDGSERLISESEYKELVKKPQAPSGGRPENKSSYQRNETKQRKILGGGENIK